ncbi:MAG TPA: SDR family NAD(P)-dependent oxidoreductase [Balneolaceae bacterium]|nr:SDR family NAD(P)-dependent oxidoreductase [Balneolaceae bacterium]
MELDFSNKHIIVTGGTGALGSSVVQLLTNSGAKCSIPCFNKSELEGFQLKNDENIFVQTGIDLTDEAATETFFNQAVKKQGELWASVHTAGGFAMGSIEKTTLADFNKQHQINLVTCYNSCRTAVGLMRKSGGGRIINIASRPAIEQRQGKGRIAYTVAKAGVAALTRALAEEVVGDGILVNAIAPSIIDSEQNRKSMPKVDFDKWPKPEQYAYQIAYLISPQNEITNGAVIPVYGKS